MSIRLLKIAVLLFLPFSAFAYPSIKLQVNNLASFGFRLDQSNYAILQTTGGYWCTADGEPVMLANKLSVGMNTAGHLCVNKTGVQTGVVTGVFAYYYDWDSLNRLECLYYVSCNTYNVKGYGWVCSYALQAGGKDISKGKYPASCGVASVENPSDSNGYVATIKFNLDAPSLRGVQ